MAAWRRLDNNLDESLVSSNNSCSGKEVRYSVDSHWQTFAFYPETIKTDELRRDWLANHRNICEIFGPTANAFDENDEEGPLTQPAPGSGGSI